MGDAAGGEGGDVEFLGNDFLGVVADGDGGGEGGGQEAGGKEDGGGLHFGCWWRWNECCNVVVVDVKRVMEADDAELEQYGIAGLSLTTYTRQHIRKESV